MTSQVVPAQVVPCLTGTTPPVEIRIRVLSTQGVCNPCLVLISTPPHKKLYIKKKVKIFTNLTIKYIFLTN